MTSKSISNLLWTAGGLAIAALVILLPEGFYARVEQILESTTGPYWNYSLIHLGDLDVTPSFVVKSILYLIFLAAGANLISRVLRRRILVHLPFDEGRKFAMSRFAGYLVFAVGLIVGLQGLGVNLNSLTVLGGAIGIGIGLGLQGIANNFVSGLILLIERPIKVGDRVEVDGLNGDVINIAGRGTWVRTNDNVMMVIPNSEFISKRVTNWTAHDRQVRFPLPIGVSYGSNPEKVRDVLLEVADGNANVLRTPAPDVLFLGFGDSSLDFELRVWTEARVQTPRVLKSELYFEAFRKFTEHGIEIPFPQRDLHVRSVSSGVREMLRPTA